MHRALILAHMLAVSRYLRLLLCSPLPLLGAQRIVLLFQFDSCAPSPVVSRLDGLDFPDNTQTDQLLLTLIDHSEWRGSRDGL